jgi:hypothetical protein
MTRTIAALLAAAAFAGVAAPAAAQTKYFAREDLAGTPKKTAVVETGPVCGASLANSFASTVKASDKIQDNAVDMSQCQVRATATKTAGTCSLEAGTKALYYSTNVLTTRSSGGSTSVICK